MNLDFKDNIDSIYNEMTETIEKLLNLINQFIENQNKLFDLYIRENISQYELIKYTIDQSKNAIQQRTEEWYKLRGTCITASDVGAFLGMDKYKSAKKAIEIKSGISNVMIDNKYTRW
jgi:isopenicillin N synthase-like dioxygenase